MRSRFVWAGAASALLALMLSVASGPATGAATPSRCTIEGTAGDDVLRGTRKADVVCGRGGDDRISSKSRGDVLRGGSGRDLLRGGAGTDLLEGGSGPDRLQGQSGDDVLTGGRGRDDLDGGRGIDVVDGVSEPGATNQPPAITELAFIPREIDTSASSATTTLRFRAQDDNAAEAMSVTLQGPRSAARQLIFPGRDNRVSGDTRNGVYTVPVTLPHHAAPGEWRIENFSVYDDLYSGTSYSYADLSARGFAASFAQVGPGDQQAPTLRGFTVTPDRFDVTDGRGQPLEIEISMADDLSGLESWTLGIHHREGARRADYTTFFPPQELEVEQQIDYSFPPGPTADPDPTPPPAGTYELEVSVTDMAGNEQIYSSEELASRGFTASFYNGP